jgi:hypothetical protein
VCREDVTETLAKFITEGKIGGFGFSEIAPSSAAPHAVHPVWPCKADTPGQSRK